MSKSHDPRPPGALRRLPGEKWLDFHARQQAAQDQQRAAHALMLRTERGRLRAILEAGATWRWYEDLDHDHSMDA